MTDNVPRFKNDFDHNITAIMITMAAEQGYIELDDKLQKTIDTSPVVRFLEEQNND